MLNLVPATGDTVARFAGGPTPGVVHALAFEREGELLGVIGVYCERGHYIAFGEFGDDVRAEPRALVKAYKRLKELSRGLHVVAFAEETVSTSGRFLEHVGFALNQTGKYEIDA